MIAFGCRPTVIVGLTLQQCIALFVLKTGAGFSIFKWVATLASDFLSRSLVGAKFFFDADIISKGWFLVNVVSINSVISNRYLIYSAVQLPAVIFFMASVQMMYYVSLQFVVLYKFSEGHERISARSHAMDHQAFVCPPFTIGDHTLPADHVFQALGFSSS